MKKENRFLYSSDFFPKRTKHFFKMKSFIHFYGQMLFSNCFSSKKNLFFLQMIFEKNFLLCRNYLFLRNFLFWPEWKIYMVFYNFGGKTHEAKIFEIFTKNKNSIKFSNQIPQKFKKEN